MVRMSVLTPETARGAAADLLGELLARHGQVGPMVATMANSPSVLGGYLQLSRALTRAKLDRAVSERISLAVQEQQGCELCLAAHTDAARGLGLSEDEITLARLGTSSDARVAPMIAFGLAVYASPSSITDAQLDELRALGDSDREIADVVGVVALNLLTGAFNLVAGLSAEPEPPPPRP